MYLFFDNVFVNDFILNKKSKKIQYLFSVSFILIISIICFIFSLYVNFDAVGFVLLVTLSIIALFCEMLPVLLAAVLSAVIWDFFFIKPRFNFQIGHAEDKIMLSMYLIIA